MSDIRKLDVLEFKNKKFVKVMFENKSSVGDRHEYKMGEIEIANVWNPLVDNPKDMGGFNFSVEESIIRWLHKGNVIYDVSIPDDAEVYDCWYPSTPNVVYRSNKIIVSNPRCVDDVVALEYLNKAELKDELYPKVFVSLIKGKYYNTAMEVYNRYINSSNLDEVIEEFEYTFRDKNTNLFDITGLDEKIVEIYNLLKK